MSALTKVSLFFTTLLLVTRAPATSTAAAVKVAGLNTTTTESSTSEPDNNDWRDNTLIYHIWPRSFQDSDGDGQGDLQGIISRLNYLIDLGVGTIRLSSIYSSLQIDSEYNILNHTDIDPLYGDFNDFYELIHQAHDKDLKVILDIIPNQSSNQHEWFLLSVSNTEPYNNYYIWTDGKILDNKVIPPNNWKSAYSNDEGSAWTWHMQRKQWYYHKYHDTEPDLNLRNEDIIQEILDIFDFWLGKGVDGFCICGVSFLFENENLLDESLEIKSNKHNSHENNSDKDDNDDNNKNNNINNISDNDYAVSSFENAALLYRFRKHIDEWVKDNNDKPKLLIGEVDEHDNQVLSYYGNETHDGIIPLNLIFITKLNDSINAQDFKNLIKNWLDNLPEGTKTNWMLSNQDYSRAASRLNPDLLDGLYMIILLLPGQAVTYYGEEIGMLDTNISRTDSINIKALEQTKDNYYEFFKNKVRSPMQWDNITSAGFSTNETTFLPINSNYININVKKQLCDTDSDLEAYKKLAILRKNPIFINGNYEFNTTNNENVFILKRSLGNDTCLVIINFGPSKETMNLTALYPDLEEDLQVMVDSSIMHVKKENDEDDDTDIENDSFLLAGNAAAVLCDRNGFKDFLFETASNDNSSNDDDDNNGANHDINNSGGGDDNDNSDDIIDKEDGDGDNSKENKPKDIKSSSVKDSASNSDAQNSVNIKQVLLFIIIIQLTLVLFV